jgi:putative transposase
MSIQLPTQGPAGREFRVSDRKTPVPRRNSICGEQRSWEARNHELWHHELRPTLAKIGICLIEDLFRWVLLFFRSTKSVQAENLFLRRQLALFLERGVRPRRLNPASRVSLAVLARLFEWRGALVVVQPATMIRWHRAGWRLLWRFKSRPGRRPLSADLRTLIRRMATENPLWGEERIASELLVKLGVRVSPRTVRNTCP